jgi:hypothetical protein
MQKACRQCSAAFEITPEDLRFYDDVSPVIGGKKMQVPPPTLCPECRFRRRLAFRNERHLYHRKSDLSGKQIISIYAPDKPYKVYSQEEWWSDAWDPLRYGRDFDFSQPFSEQFSALCTDVPFNAVYTTNCENCDYANHLLSSRNCYLVYGGGNDEDCLYGRFVNFSKDCVDSLSLYHCERCYEGIASQRCYGCIRFQNCRDCTDCWMVADCQGCSDCIGCFGLVKKQYCVLNEQLTKEEYLKRKADLVPLTPQVISVLNQWLAKMSLQQPHRAAHITGSENCTGDMITNSKNCHECYDVTDCEDSKFQCYTPKSVHSYDATYTAPEGVEWCNEVGSTVGVPRSMATFLCWYGSDMLYSRDMHHCRDCFGCVGLKRKQYCVFNKQYTKEQYEELVPRIIEHMRKTAEWGEYLLPQTSLMGYNETVAQELYPLTKEEALKQGWKWHDEPAAEDAYKGPEVKIPAKIGDVTDDILKQVHRCEVSGKLYKINPQELKFYRGLGLPVPRRSPDQRHKDRVALRNPRHLWDRQCAKCRKPIRTTFSPDRPETVYCEECYLSTVY